MTSRNANPINDPEPSFAERKSKTKDKKERESAKQKNSVKKKTKKQKKEEEEEEEDEDIEAGENGEFISADKAKAGNSNLAGPFKTFPARSRFIQKLLLTLTLQMTFVLLVALIVYFSSLGKYFKEVWWSIFIAIGVTIIIVLLLLFAKEVCKKTPVNWFLFILFTLSIAFATAYLEAYFSGDTAGRAILYVILGITLVIFGLWFFAKLTRVDFGFFFGMIVGSVFGGIMFFVLWLGSGMAFLWAVMAAVGLAIFTFYIIWDINHIVGPELRYNLTQKDYMLGALHVFMDFFFIPFLVLACCAKLTKDDI